VAAGGSRRAAALLDRRRRARPDPAGFLDLLERAAPEPTGPAQRLMLTRAVPLVYERWWRPAFGRMAKGPLGGGMGEERRMARRLLELRPGHTVLDLACGTGDFARDFVAQVGSTGLVVGVDASPTMLARAVRETPAARAPDGNVAYVRAAAERLPFRAATCDAVCCFAALHLFADPWSALDEIARVLAPGGRVALLASCRTGPAPLRPLEAALGAGLGAHMFERDAIPAALRARGFLDVRQRVTGLVQYVGARRT
jgi:SAM-dependent methyltransferase